MTIDLPPPEPKKPVPAVVLQEKCDCGCGLTLTLCERRSHLEERLARATQRLETGQINRNLLNPRTPPHGTKPT